MRNIIPPPRDIVDHDYGSESSDGHGDEDESGRPYRSQLKQMMKLIQKNERIGRGDRGEREGRGGFGRGGMGFRGHGFGRPD